MELIPRTVPTLAKLDDLAANSKLIPNELFIITENKSAAIASTSSSYRIIAGGATEYPLTIHFNTVPTDKNIDIAYDMTDYGDYIPPAPSIFVNSVNQSEFYLDDFIANNSDYVITFKNKITAFSLAFTDVVIDFSEFKDSLRYIGINPYTNPLIEFDSFTKLIFLKYDKTLIADVTILTETRLTNNPNLSYIYFNDYGNLHLLTITNCPKIQHIHLKNCNFSADELNSVFTQLPDRTGLTAGDIDVVGNPGAGTCNIALATAKNYTVKITP